MVHPKCPAASQKGYQRVALAINMFRFAREEDLDTDEMVEQKGKYYWDHITSLVNQEKQVFTRDDVLEMAEGIQDFHANEDCDCIGKSLSKDLKDRGPPKFPRRDERELWNHTDQQQSVPIGYISKSSMTSDGSNKRICVYNHYNHAEVNPQPSEVPSLDELFCAPRVIAESNGDWMVRMMNHYELPSDIMVPLGVKLLDNPSMFPVIVNYKENDLFSFIRSVSPGVFDNWYMEWSARNRSRGLDSVRK